MVGAGCVKPSKLLFSSLIILILFFGLASVVQAVGPQPEKGTTVVSTVSEHDADGSYLLSTYVKGGANSRVDRVSFILYAYGPKGNLLKTAILAVRDNPFSVKLVFDTSFASTGMAGRFVYGGPGQPAGIGKLKFTEKGGSVPITPAELLKFFGAKAGAIKKVTFQVLAHGPTWGVSSFDDYGKEVLVTSDLSADLAKAGQARAGASATPPSFAKKAAAAVSATVGSIAVPSQPASAAKKPASAAKKPASAAAKEYYCVRVYSGDIIRQSTPCTPDCLFGDTDVSGVIDAVIKKSVTKLQSKKITICQKDPGKIGMCTDLKSALGGLKDQTKMSDSERKLVDALLKNMKAELTSDEKQQILSDALVSTSNKNLIGLFSGVEMSANLYKVPVLNYVLYKAFVKKFIPKQVVYAFYLKEPAFNARLGDILKNNPAGKKVTSACKCGEKDYTEGGSIKAGATCKVVKNSLGYFSVTSEGDRTTGGVQNFVDLGKIAFTAKERYAGVPLMLVKAGPSFMSGTLIPKIEKSDLPLTCLETRFTDPQYKITNGDLAAKADSDSFEVGIAIDRESCDVLDGGKILIKVSSSVDRSQSFIASVTVLEKVSRVYLLEPGVTAKGLLDAFNKYGYPSASWKMINKDSYDSKYGLMGSAKVKAKYFFSLKRVSADMLADASAMATLIK